MINLNIKLPNGFLDEEIRCDYKVEKKTKELWAVQLDILAELQRVCDKNGLKVFADGGTLLGAVRHKGYIPWDDDIDVTMLRDDYEKLKKYAYKDFKSEYFFQTTYTDKIIRSHAQLRRKNTTCFTKNDYKKRHNRGIFIDIFVTDNLPESHKELIEHQTKLKNKYNGLLPPEWNKSKKYNRVLVIGYNALVILPQKVWYYVFKYPFIQLRFKDFEKTAMKYNDNTSTVGNATFLGVMGKSIRSYSIEGYMNPIKLPFENTYILCPSNYDDYLKKNYGNYMEYVIGSSNHGDTYANPNMDYSYYDSLSETEFFKMFDE